MVPIFSRRRWPCSWPCWRTCDRDTPQSCGLPTIEKWRNDYPKNYSEKQEEVLTTREIFFKYVLNNKMLWFIAIANAFVYMVRYGCLDWAPTYLKEAQGYDIKEGRLGLFRLRVRRHPGHACLRVVE